MFAHRTTTAAALLALTLTGCGKKDPPPGATGTTVGDGGGPFTGLRVSGAVDLTGDGAADVLISAPGLEGDGAVRIFGADLTGDLGPDDAAATISAHEADAIGEGLAPCGDVDGDGISDLLIGMPEGLGGRGGMWLFNGPLTGDLQTDDGFLTRGNEDNGKAGYTVACGGDSDGNGTADMLLSAPLAPGFGTSDMVGQVQFLIGGDAGGTAVIANATTTLGSENLGFQRSLSNRHDLDGDGLADAIIGGPGGSRLRVLFAPFAGTINANETGNTYFGRENTDSFGHSSATGDLNGDGYIDVAAGAPMWDAQFGAVAIIDGPLPNGDHLLAEPTRWIEGQDPRELTGFSLAIADDLDGDGLADLLAGAPGATTSGPMAGVVYGVLGPANIAAMHAADHVFVGSVPFAEFGHSVDAVPDATGDGLDEVLIGAPYRDQGKAVRAGAAMLFHSPLSDRTEDVAATTTYLF